MLLAHSPAWATNVVHTTNIYRWVDASGGVHYADHPYSPQARPVNLSIPDAVRPAAALAGQTPAPATAPSSPHQGSPHQVNINNADAATLAKVLHGVGEQKAAAIVAHRNKHGPFKSVDALNQVKGIGEKPIAKNRPRIAVR